MFILLYGVKIKKSAHYKYLTYAKSIYLIIKSVLFVITVDHVCVSCNQNSNKFISFLDVMEALEVWQQK